VYDLFEKGDTIVLQVKSLFLLQKFSVSMSLRAERSNLIKYLRDCFVASLLAMTCLYCSLLRYVLGIKFQKYALWTCIEISLTLSVYRINNFLHNIFFYHHLACRRQNCFFTFIFAPGLVVYNGVLHAQLLLPKLQCCKLRSKQPSYAQLGRQKSSQKIRKLISDG